MTPSPDQKDQSHKTDQLQTLQEVVKGLDLTPEDLLLVLSSVVSLKNKKSEEPSQNKVFQEKYFIWENSTDGFIYRDGRTKSKNFYLRIYCKETKKVFSKSLRTSSKEEGIVLGRKLYQEKYGKLVRGEKTRSITTSELIKIHLEREERKISPIPKTGITKQTFIRKSRYLKIWETYVREGLEMENTPIEKIPPDRTRDFGYWRQNQEKLTYKRKGGWSNQCINSIISEVKRMYHQVGVRDKFILPSQFPEIDYLKVQPSGSKRDILSVEENKRLVLYLRTNQYLKPEGSSKLEQGRRSIFREFIGISYNTGMRPNELLQLKWSDVSINITDSEEDKRVFRILKVRTENSKTGKMRSVNGPVGRRLERLKETYESLGFECGPDQYIFKNTHPRKKGENVPYYKTSFTDKLDKVLIESGIQKSLDLDGRRITLYSSRHFYTTLRLQNGLDIHLLSKQLGTSTKYIDDTYSHIQVESNTERITQGMSLLSTLQEL